VKRNNILPEKRCLPSGFAEITNDPAEIRIVNVFEQYLLSIVFKPANTNMAMKRNVWLLLTKFLLGKICTWLKSEAIRKAIIMIIIIRRRSRKGRGNTSKSFKNLRAKKKRKEKKNCFPNSAHSARVVRKIRFPWSCSREERCYAGSGDTGV
jgi:hypothetical protein